MKSLESDFEKNLSCKNCNGENLHIEKVYIYKGVDDYETTGVLCYEPENFTMKEQNLKSNVRVREPSLVLEIYCEGCASVNDLTLASHKGKIYVD